ncbi:hypothetical protein G6F70_002383 [Rhizopus microsporus]|nr:hypothetical protein G6F71_002533 [Rhizopus microsporus]KAG1202297.1 hypothetical protein G6F70_002383 [Rhizopus microsporus]KAG1213984.1 hypothetical protein G6F69_002328 [Rhizopus microsporus]KAG1236311.1 hypothetical protein G6F67_002081 [Rhizopus microsporus]KAG1268246.1 hypothetical protein G6F68_001269 [Rhizopus microsporus]
MSGQQVFFNILRPVFTRRGIVLNIARRYASKKKLEASMGGQQDISPKQWLSKKTVQDLLPDQHQLELLIQHKQIHLAIEKQQALVKHVLDHIANDTPVDTNQVLDYGAPVALELYRIAMEKGDDRGAFSYANMIYRGYRGTPKNEERGVQIMSQLAQKGHPYAQMNLAAIIMRTQPSRVDAAIQLYELAGRAGVDSAYTELGRMYRHGFGIHQDHVKAVEYFKQGAQSGNPQCNFMLGVYHSSNLIGEPDQQKAFKYFQKAAVKGMPEAQYNVGLRFLRGHGVEVNHFNAAEFFRMAALQGFQLAQINLAGMYTEGRGVKKDLEEARKWLEKASASGGKIGKDAQKRIEELDQIEGKKKNNDRCNIM